MSCKSGCKNEIPDEQKKILEAMAGMTGPCGSKDIANVTGIDAKDVSNAIKTLKAKGYIGSPVRCKYEITAEGKSAI